MAQPMGFNAGEPAPQTGVYLACDSFGVATSQTAHIQKDQPLPRTSLGFSWRLLQSTGGQSDARPTTSKPLRGFGNLEHPR